MFLFYIILFGLPISLAVLYASQRHRTRVAFAELFSEKWFNRKENRLFESLLDFLIGIGAVFIPLALIIICDFLTNKILGNLMGHPENPDYENTYSALTFLIFTTFSSITFFNIYYDANKRGSFNFKLMVVLTSVYFAVNLIIMLIHIFLNGSWW